MKMFNGSLELQQFVVLYLLKKKGNSLLDLIDLLGICPDLDFLSFLLLLAVIKSILLITCVVRISMQFCLDIMNDFFQSLYCT